MTTDIVQLKNMIADLKMGGRDRIITDKVSTTPRVEKRRVNIGYRHNTRSQMNFLRSLDLKTEQ